MTARQQTDRAAGAAWPVRIGIGLSVVALLATSACGVDPSKSKPGGDAPKGGATTKAPDAPRAEFARVDPGTVAGWTMTTYADDSRGIRAEVPVVPGARTLSSAMEVVRERTLRTAAQEGATAVSVTTSVVAASPQAVGIQVTRKITSPKGERTEPVIVWYDAATRRVHSSPILVDAQQWGAFKQAVAKTVAKDKAVDPKKLSQALDAEAAPQGIGPALAFDAQGNLVARFGAGAVSDQPIGLVVAAKDVDPVLSTFGRSAQAAAKAPSAFDPSAAPSGAAPTPSASASPSATPGNQVPRPSTAVGVDCTKAKCVALTYDDGPGADTAQVLEAFTKAGAAATFFQLGDMIRANPKVARQVASSGMEVASHSMSHPDLARIGADKLKREVEGASAIMKETYGRSPMLLRPPYGSHNKAVDDLAARNGLGIIQWNADTNDWKTKNTASTEASASAARADSIVLMHDIHPSTVAAAPGIVRDLQAKGLTLVTVSELALNSGSYEAGHAYCTTTNQKQSGFGCAG
ncbi:polysaccharide deacetylase family protein [Mariniluteicoccus flavus]